MSKCFSKFKDFIVFIILFYVVLLVMDFKLIINLNLTFSV